MRLHSAARHEKPERAHTAAAALTVKLEHNAVIAETLLKASRPREALKKTHPFDTHVCEISKPASPFQRPVMFSGFSLPESGYSGLAESQ